jgi:putative tryptophan/tyrosine transport system substrate-binding protein
MMRRREFITLVVSAAAAWPVAARAQQAGGVRRVGVLMVGDEIDPMRQSWLAALTRRLAELGWADGRNLRMEVRWAGNDVGRMETLAKALAELQPDAILAAGTPATAALQRQTHAIPTVFLLVADPVGDRFVASLPRPGANITGFGDAEAPIVSKWLDLLTEIAPGVKRAAMMFNPATAPYVEFHYWPEYDAAARLLKVAPIAAPVHDEADIAAAVTSLGREYPGITLGLPRCGQ